MGVETGWCARGACDGLSVPPHLVMHTHIYPSPNYLYLCIYTHTDTFICPFAACPLFLLL